MTQSQYSLAWDSYKSNICSGFSSLQQNGEFVDMTLAADGHLVKVHQVIIALSSSYLKNIISSVPSQHPVIFLNNISHKVLCFLLEYIYTGEVLVPSQYLSQFTEAAKSLHIKGLENVMGIDTQQNSEDAPENVSTIYVDNIVKKRKTTDFHQILPAKARKIYIKPESTMSVDENYILPDPQKYSTEILDDSLEIDDSDYEKTTDKKRVTDPQPVDLESAKANTSSLLYTMSIRGSLQVILNRYIYNLISKTKRNVKRWRCVDYRNIKCAAFITTKGNVVLHRANLHNHPFHDKKILAKIEKKAVFAAYDDVQAYKEKEKNIERDILEESDDSSKNVQYKSQSE